MHPRAHRALNEAWRAYFARQPTNDPTPEVLAANLLPDANVPWGPDAHELDDDLFRVYFQNMHGFFTSQRLTPVLGVSHGLPPWP
jgi:hypothetical protein